MSTHVAKVLFAELENTVKAGSSARRVESIFEQISVPAAQQAIRGWAAQSVAERATMPGRHPATGSPHR